MTRKTTDSRCEEGSSRTDFVGMLRGAGLLLAGCAAAVLLFSVAGCSATDADEPSIVSTAEVLEENASEKSVEYASFEEVAAAFDASALNLEYSKRDMDASFDESSATKITLSGDSASVSGSGAAAEGSTVTISTAGTYIVSGNLTDGSITVTTSENDKVQIVLNSVKIACSSGPAIDVQSADTCFITLAEGTQNSLSDGSAFASEDANACIYATCDLTINGSGSLDVSGNYRHGVFSKDDLVVYGGSINVSAVEDGLNGKNSVKIGAGDISIDSGADGVKSSKSTNPEKGFVYVSGGSLSIDAEDDGIQAKTYLCIAGGSIEIDAADDALHSDLEGALNGGLTSVRSGDDAFHCETKLEVNDGSFVAEACNEGYEAEQVVVNGGDTNICALDDAMNASAADLSDDSESSDADTSTIAPSGEPGANAAQLDGSIGVPDASSANADSNGQQNTAPQGAGQQGQLRQCGCRSGQPCLPGGCRPLCGGCVAHRGRAGVPCQRGAGDPAGADPHAGMLCPALPHRRGRRDSGRRCRRRAPALYGKACGPAGWAGAWPQCGTYLERPSDGGCQVESRRAGCGRPECTGCRGAGAVPAFAHQYRADPAPRRGSPPAGVQRGADPG